MVAPVEIVADPRDFSGTWAPETDSARRILVLVLLLAVKDRATQVRFDPSAGESRLSYIVDGNRYPLVPPPEHFNSEWAAVLRDRSRSPRMADRLAAILRRYASRLDGGLDQPPEVAIRLRFKDRSLDCQAFFWPTPLGEAFAINLPPPSIDAALSRAAQAMMRELLPAPPDEGSPEMAATIPSLRPPLNETIEGARIGDRRRSCRDLLEACLARIDEWEPRVHAWVVIDREGTRRQADILDAEWAADLYRGPLHGIPVGIKDIIDVAGLPTACGAGRWKDRAATADAPLVARLREAGAVIIGKTVTTPYAWIDPPPTRNPWKLDRTPGGSSSGSAAALACGMVLGALGTQTGGSIARPAAFCGVCGLKPTVGRLSIQGILPFALSLDHPGPMARTIGDLAYLWHALAGTDPRDVAEPPLDAPVRLGRLRGYFDVRADPIMREALDAAADRLRAAGMTVEDVAPPLDFESILADHRLIMAAEAAGVHEHWLAEHPDDYPPRIRALVEEGLTLPAAAYARTRSRQAKLYDTASEALHGFDAFLTPSALGTAPGPDTTGDPAMNSPWSFLGLPTVTLPIGLSPDALPLAMQLVASYFREAPLLAIARRCERALNA